VSRFLTGIVLLSMLFFGIACSEPAICKQVKNDTSEYLGTFSTMQQCQTACGQKGYVNALYVIEDNTNTCKGGCGCM